MKHTLYIIVIVSLALFSCGEGKKDRQLLDCIEQTWQLCETSLPEAQAQAESMKDSVSNASELIRQRYDLLCIRLRDNLYLLPSTPDSALQTVSFFEGRANMKDKERAYYYLGSTYRDLKDYPRAVSLFLKATEVAEQSKAADTLIWQNALSQLRFLYMLQLNYEEELNVAMQTVELAKASGKNQAWYLMDVASACEHLSDTAQCLQYMDLSYQALQEEHFPSKYGSLLSSMLTTYSKYNRYEKVDTLLQHLMQLPEEQRPQNYELCLARYFEQRSQTDSAIVHYRTYYGKTAEAAGRYEASAGLQRCFLQKGDYRQAAEWGRRLYETNDSVIAQRAFEQTERARDEYRYLRDQEAESAIMQRDQRIIFFSVITSLVLLSMAMGLVAFYYFRKKKYLEAISDKDRLLEQKAMVNKELTRIALMNIATEKADEVLTHFRNIAAGKAKLNEGSWDGLMAAMETLHPDFLEAVEGRMNKPLQEPLLRTVCLLKIGMKPAQIAKVMDAKIQTVWNRVKRAEEICGDLLTVS